MKVSFWNTRPTPPIYHGTHEIEFRGVVSATIPLPEPNLLSQMIVVNELHHDIEGQPEKYDEVRRFATVKRVVVDRKHGEPKLRYYFK